MSDASLAVLEKRAAAAEARIKALEAASSAKPSAGASHADFVPRLKELREVIVADQQEAETVRAQRDELREENEALKEQVSKLNYRIKHLLRTIEEQEGRK